MCSIGGFISKNPLSPDLAKRLADGLIWYGSERGRQSAGVYVDGRIAKRAMEPQKFVSIKAYRRLFHSPTTIVLTHTRQPTCGGLGDEQAQPFRCGRAVTIHNGMLSNTSDLREKFGIAKPSGVDSELFASFVDKHGPEALPDFCDAAHGSLAIAAVFEGKLYLVREQSPLTTLVINMTDGNQLAMFASTEQILRMAASHAFLIPPSYSTKDPSFGDLFALDHTGLTKVKDQVNRVSYGGHHSVEWQCGNYGRGTYNKAYDAPSFWRGQGTAAEYGHYRWEKGKRFWVPDPPPATGQCSLPICD